MPRQGRIYAIADQFRREMLRRERAAASEMVRQYGAIWQRIKIDLERLTRQYWEQVQNGEDVPISWLFEANRLQTLQQQVEREIAVFAQQADISIRAQQWEAVQAAGRYFDAQMASQLSGVGVLWNRLPREAVADLIGFTQKGSPLRELLDELGPQASKSIRKALVSGLALGQNPREIARQVRKALGGNLARALTISRTETLRAWREAGYRQALANSDILEGWEWLSAKQERTCAACLAMDGTVHKLIERLDDHPNGRCTRLEIVKGFPREKRETGAEWFDKQPDSVQRKVLGDAGYEAYKAGVVSLQDFVGRSHSRDWGTTRYARSLKEILGASEARSWRQLSLSLKAVGADVHKLAVLREVRLGQLRQMTGEQIDSLMQKMTSAIELPRLAYHYQRHGKLLGVSSQEEYLALFREHIRRPDLAIGTALRPKDQAKMWYLVGVDTRMVAQYNETVVRYWTFMPVANLEAYLRDAGIWWVRARRQGNAWSFEPWTL